MIGRILLSLALVLSHSAVLAQSAFSPVIRVNDKAITAYDLQQRERLLQVLGAPGDLAEEARTGLINERLQVQAAEALGISVTEERLSLGVDEYVTRVNLSADEFLEVLRQGGVAEETFLDFIEAGVVWREVVRAQFASRSRISEDEVDRAIALAGQSGGARVLVSEIVLPARNAQELSRADALVAEISLLRGIDAFSAAARNVSASPSRERGGRLDWLSLNEVPPQLRTEFLTLPVGGITQPLRSQDAIAIFQLRALEETPLERPETIAMDYALFRLPGASAAEANAITSQVDTCDDFYGIAQGLPKERLDRETLAPADVPSDVLGALAGLDENETTTFARGDTQLVLMLCGRTTQDAETLDRGAVRNRLSNLRTASYADAFLAELRADAEIIDLR